MSEFLEQLKSRLIDAQKRHQIATQKLQFAQQEHAAATQDFASWQNAVRVETIREQQEQEQRQREQQQLYSSPAPAPQPAPAAVDSQTERDEPNKTDAIRQMFHAHPEGLRPTEIWKQLGSQLKHRAYLYSVLKRLKDKGELRESRGKYFLKVIQKLSATEEKPNVVVQ